MYEEKAKKAVIAKMDIQRDLSSQTTNFKLRLAQRKKQLELKRSGFLDEDDNKSTLSNNRSAMRQHPQSTRSSVKYLPRFGDGMLAELNELPPVDRSNDEMVQGQPMRPQPFSTKARDQPCMMENGKRVMFPGEAEMGED